ncbi:hypothetical protein A0H81_09616 [Grifola frondosa]|uniref:Uncharacterized protein n=1 Tax=Grifola frondosa TaxID=5627 RepID=A0A1C7M0U6_GRIFR|nr:hypothetical protein A0H81_09616 [Grifola frondosa]
MLQRQLEAWADIQQLYMPGVATLRAQVLASTQNSSPTSAENFPLLLPSTAFTKLLCNPRLLAHEWELRFGQAHETLDDLRCHLRLCTHMYKYKDRFVCGQRENTRARTTIATVEAKVAADADHYCKAYAALEALATPLETSGWNIALRPLLPQDIKGFEEDKNILRDCVQLSWIWKTPRIERSGAVRAGGEVENVDEAEDTQEALCIEWCKSRARASRWWEECYLLLEEMWRVMAFYTWQSLWWEDQADRRVDVDDALAEGLFAYAHRQAELRRDMWEFCRKSWAGVQEYTRIANAAIGLPDDASEITL